MSKEKFILVSLKEEESKKLAQIISNDTSRKILDFLDEKETTESELAEKLNIPLSTIHYNLQALLKGRLVEADEYHYSEKGKEVLHYKLANKYVIIAPKSTFGIKEKLKRILPVGIIALVGSSAIYLYGLIQNQFSGSLIAATPQAAFTKSMANARDAIAEEAVATAVPQTAIELAQDNAVGSAPVIAEIGKTTTESFWQTFLQNPALWFLFGCVFTIILIILIEYMIYKRQNK